MSQSEKAAYFQALKAAGVNFDRHYRTYTTDELKAAHDRLVEQGVLTVDPPPQGVSPVAAAAEQAQAPAPVDEEAAAFFGFNAEPAAAPDPEPVLIMVPPREVLDVVEAVSIPAPPPMPVAPVRPADPNEMAGQRQSEELAPIRTDENGRVWYQEEVRKPAFPKPRGRRVLKYMDPGVKQETVQVGKYTETFEIPGDPANARPAEVKITLPSYQVGIYRDPRFPFKVVTYNDNEGFDLEDVQAYYGGAELVPEDVKRKYVENVLCYDIRTVVRAIENEYRTRVLGQKL